MSVELAGPPGELSFTLEITRAETGQTETVELVGHLIATPEPEPEEDA